MIALEERSKNMSFKQMEKIQMVDLQGQYQRLKSEIDPAIAEVLESAWYIKGPVVERFEGHLADYLDVPHVIGVANGTDALQVALMALGLEPGDEVIVPAFTYVATAEVIALLHLKPVMVDADPDTFNLTPEIFEAAITPNTKAVVPVHLFGQTADMEGIMEVARRNGIFVIEDNAQAIGARYEMVDGRRIAAGTIGHVGTTSFFPAKNLGCFGDGGALFTRDSALAQRIRMIANHGQSKRYYHDEIGVNSRLDALQAAVLDVKLHHLDDFANRRNNVAHVYDQAFQGLDEVQTPVRSPKSNHVFHQYTLRIKNGKRDALKAHLNEQGIPANIYYPVPLYKQKAFHTFTEVTQLPETERLCREVLSLPIHTEMQPDTQNRIIQGVLSFFDR